MANSDTRSVAHAVRTSLGRDIFVPATSRLLWIPVHLAVFALGVGASVWWSARGNTLLLLLPVSLVVGFSFAGLAFVAHETLHGSLLRGRISRHVVGLIGFLPFCVSPRLWVAWHNQVHHGSTNVPGRDPDAYPTLAEYEASQAARLAVDFGAPRRGKWRGLITLLVGFSLQSLQILVFSRSRKYLTRSGFMLAWGETLVGVCVWALLWSAVGAKVFVFVFVIPLMVANSLVMAHIITNHSLSPLCDDNDALETSLTVSVPRWFEFYSLGFGYHVEHHLFPAMSNRHAPRVQAELRRLVPQRYQEMPLGRALVLMFSTPRVYASARLLVDPNTQETWATLGPSELSAGTDKNARRLTSRASRRTSGGDYSAVSMHAKAERSQRISSIPPPPRAA